MGKGDRRSKKGKIWRGSFGNSRPKRVAEVAVVAEEKAVAKKAPAKKTTSKKAAASKGEEKTV